ncbi:rhomboid family intramembrane serine protease [Kitasatospora sp. NPDC050467]|uniref:rhomboid family intramembrane serine protease n=1 Tax=Kitasatospora sp. NPDC050467 TaxID=3364053 RepID=UPI0037A851C0
MASKTARLLADSRQALFTMLGVLAVLWLVQLVNWTDDYGLSREWGLRSQRLDELPDILTMPLLHGSWDHIEANSWPLFAFGFLAAYRGMKKFLWVSLVVLLTGGLTVWLFERPEAVTVGASGMVYGYFGYVVLRGLLDRNLLDAVIGVVVAAAYAYVLLGVVPGDPGISWLGHLGGLIGGLGGAWLFRNRGPKPATAPEPAARQAAALQATGPRSALLKELDDLGL